MPFTGTGLTPAHVCTGTGLSPLPLFAPGLDSPLPTSAPGLGSPLPTSAPGLGSTLPTAAPGLGSRPCQCLHRDSTRYLIYTLIYICTGTGRTPAHDCTGTGPTPAHDCTGTGPTPATSAARLGPPLPANFPGFQVAAASGLALLPFRTGSIRHRRHGSQRPWQVGQSQAPFALTVPLTGAANESAAADKYGCRCAAVATARAVDAHRLRLACCCLDAYGGGAS